MNSSTPCLIKGHQSNLTNHICLYEYCQLPRWVCEECLIKKIHSHDHDYIYSQKDLQNKIKNEVDIDEQQMILKYNNISQNLEFMIGELNQYYQKIKQMCTYLTDNQYLSQKQYLLNIDLNKFTKFDDIIINNLIYFFKQSDKQKIEIEQPIIMIQQQMTHIEKQVSLLNNTIQHYDNIDKRRYNVEKIDQNNNGIYYGCSISKNENFVAYGGEDGLLSIYNLKKKKQIKSSKLKGGIVVCEFSENSSQLFVGDSEGHVLGFKTENDFELIYSQQIHKCWINDIIPLQNQSIITCSQDRTIIMTNVLTSQQILKILCPEYPISILFRLKANQIICSSVDQSIKFWNCSDIDLVINKQQSHATQIMQIQLIEDSQNLLTLDFQGQIYKWKIDFIHQNLIKISEYQDKHRIYNFYSVNNHKNLIIICEKYVKILNQEGKVELVIHHQGGPNYNNLGCKQLDNLNYILIRSEDQIIMLEYQPPKDI